MVDRCHSRRVYEHSEWLVHVKKTLIRWKRGQTYSRNRQKTRAFILLTNAENCPLCRALYDKGDSCLNCYNCIVNYVFSATCSESEEVQDLTNLHWIGQHTYKEQLLKITYVVEAIEEMIEVLENGRKRVSRAIQ